MAGEHHAIAVVGAGPRGTSVLERICASVPELLPDARLTVHMVDPAPPGPGRVWRTAQPRELLMNTVASQVTLFTDSSVQCEGPVRPGPSLYEWALSLSGEDLDPLLLAEARALGPDDYPSRAFYGSYLAWVFRRVVGGAPGSVTVEVHPARAVRLEEHADGAQALVLEDGRELGGLSAVVLAQGHLPVVPGEAEERVSSYAAAHGLRHLPPANPADVDLSRIAPGEAVLLRGLGLNFFDHVALLTTGRGGTYTTGADGSLRYRPSGSEPRLHAGSRRGIPYHARGDNEKGPWGRHEPLLLTPAVIASFRTRAEAGDFPDFLSEVWPLVAKEIETVYYEALAATRAAVGSPVGPAVGSPVGGPAVGSALEPAVDSALEPAVGLPVGGPAFGPAPGPSVGPAVDSAVGSALGGARRFRERFLAAPHGSAEEAAVLDEFGIATDVRWSWDDLARPHGGRAFGGPEDFRAWLLGHLRADAEHARLGNVAGPVKAALDVLRDLRNELRQIVDHAGLSGLSRRDHLDRWYTPLNAFLSIGPPRRRIEEMAALIEAGILDVIGPGLEIRLGTPGGGRGFTAHSPHVPGSAVTATTLIEARLPEPDLRRTDDPLLAGLLRTGACRPHVTDGYETGGLDVTVRPYRLIDREGRPHPRRFAVGIPTEGVHWVTAAGARPGVNSVTLSDADAVARAALRTTGPRPSGTPARAHEADAPQPKDTQLAGTHTGS
ncbi:FAD/NAD(P)-binding protein [Streptomyces sp. NPDC004647]|uniref:FAD/NAD(P)-binding protein n=1 Tax=Streptomyces sp. NPDC004647 TaxID=3154671 RepID=UPI0033B33726